MSVPSNPLSSMCGLVDLEGHSPSTGLLTGGNEDITVNSLENQQMAHSQAVKNYSDLNPNHNTFTPPYNLPQIAATGGHFNYLTEKDSLLPRHQISQTLQRDHGRRNRAVAVALGATILAATAGGALLLFAGAHSSTFPVTASIATPTSTVSSYATTNDSIVSNPDWIRQQNEIAWASILSNIGPAVGAADGVVVASPSIGAWDEPDYYYTWTRDSALTLSALLPSFLPESYLRPWEIQVLHPKEQLGATTSTKPLIESLLRDYIAVQEEIQQVPNPSGDLWSGGLSEPKFNVDGSPFTNNWGRPQRDGPALRALTLIPYAHYLLDRGFPADIAFVKKHLYNPHGLREVGGSIIKNDLEEVGGGWWREGFDLWEEIYGRHLFTDSVARRALQAGVILAARLGDEGASAYYAGQANLLSDHLGGHYDRDLNHWRATMDSASVEATDTTHELFEDDDNTTKDFMAQRSGLDSATLLCVVHAGGRNVDQAERTTGELSPADPDVLKTVRDFVLSFEGLYRLNDGRNWYSGWLVGRYAEDVYNGVGVSRGNPWFICTYTVAHVLYLAQSTFLDAGVIPLDTLTVSFWSDLLDLDTVPSDGNWVAGSPAFNRAIRALGTTADAFLWRTAEFIDDGRMSEQIDRSDGNPTGARDLTWSYASFLEVARARDTAMIKLQSVSLS